MRKKLLILGIMLLAVIGTVSLAPLAQGDEPDPTTDAEQAGLLPSTSQSAGAAVVAEAKLRPGKDAELGFQTNGVVASLFISEGDTVKAGDVLATLKGTEQFDLADARAQLELLQAEKELKALQDAHAKDKAAAALRVIQAKAALDDVRELFDTFDTPAYRTKLDDANKAAKDKYSDVEDAQDALDDVADLDQNSDRRKTVEDDYKTIRQDYDELERAYSLLINDRDKAQSDVTAAEAELADAERELDALADGPKKEDRDILDQRIATAKAEQASAAVDIALRKLIAPFDGEIVSLNISEGEVVPAGKVALVIADPSEKILKTVDLSETDMALVKVGNPVRVVFDAYPERTLNGTVTKITNWSELYLGDVVYPVEITLDPTGLPVLWGMTASVYFD